MSTPAQKANLARIRDNQRRSRARKREYVQELEQRIRAYEQQGVEASAEVQVAARRVADENRILRELLHRHGVGDDIIIPYLQSPGIGSTDPGTSQQQVSGNTGASVQSLQHVMTPRRAVSMDQNNAFPLPSQDSRETSTTSASTASSSVWDHSQQHISPTSYTPPQPMSVATGSSLSAAPSQQAYASFSGVPTPALGHFHGEPSQHLGGQILEHPHQQHYSNQHLPSAHPSQMPYNVHMNPYTQPPNPPYGP